MQRTLPRESKIRLSFWRGITAPDIFIGLFGLLLFAIIVSGGGAAKIVFGIFFMCLYASLFFNFGGERGYLILGYTIKHFFRTNTFTKVGKPKANIEMLNGIKKERDNIVLCKDGSAICAIKLQPIEFRLLSEEKQNYYIDDLFASALRSLPKSYEFAIYKEEQPLNITPHIQDEHERMHKTLSRGNMGELTKNEMLKRYEISKETADILEQINETHSVCNTYYLLLKGTPKNVENVAGMIAERLSDGGLTASICKPPYKVIKKSVKFNYKSTRFGKKLLYHFVITKYPLSVNNAWGMNIFDIPNTKITMRCKAVPKDKATKRIDNAIMEIAGRKRNKASKIVDAETHLATLEDLLVGLQNENEVLYDTTLIITAEGNQAMADTKRALIENGFSFNQLPARQFEAFTSSQITNLNSVKFSTGLTSSNISALFPFVSNELIEKGGMLIGENDAPVFFNAWKRDDEFVNSNILILGKTGSGKSYAAKTILTKLATENSRAFVFDPDGEYTDIANALAGKVIDVASNTHGIINPLQIMQTLGDDGEQRNDYHAHLQFLEEFFKSVLPGIDSDNLERLNNLIVDLYRKFGIDENSDVKKIDSDKFPTFDDLGLFVKSQLESKPNLEKVYTYIAKFMTGGRYSNIWNGHTSLSANEQFISFNFQSLFASKNTVIANGQMLLIYKWAENEIINNRQLNNAKHTDKHVIIAIDEAHLFIDGKHPIALDFMYQLAKRIRKYSGMLIVITQSVKDLTGTPEIARKSEAIIAASQYSLIFNLSPSDMKDLCTLYDKSGKINEVEQYCLSHNPRGAAFFIASPERRTNFKIVATPAIHKIITNKEKS